MTINLTRRHAIIAAICAITAIAGYVGYTSEGGVLSSPTVYVTNSGKKYHLEGCKWLKSKRPLSLDEAQAAGYEPCKVCKPPSKGGSP